MRERRAPHGTGVVIGLVAGTLFWALMYALFWPKAGGFSIQAPPESVMSRTGELRIRVMEQGSAKALCGILKAPKGSIACGLPGLAIVPTLESSGLSYWDWVWVVAHEIGHALGWAADHPR